MALWSAWFPDVQPHVAECPIVIMEHELRRAAQAFFEGSRVWKVTLDPVPVVAGQKTVTIAPTDPEQDLVRIETAWYDGKPLPVYSADEMDASFDEDWQEHTGDPMAVTQMIPGVARLYPVPVSDAATGLKCRVSVRPSDTATGIPDELRVKYKEAIAAGAKARLMLYPNKPWSNVDLGVAMAAAFDAAIGKSNIDAARSLGRARIASRPKWC